MYEKNNMETCCLATQFKSAIGRESGTCDTKGEVGDKCLRREKGFTGCANIN